MIARSAYIVQTQVIGLGDHPFLQKTGIRPIFHPIFTSKRCFSNMRTSILDTCRPIPLPPTPFIQNLGRVCFNPQRIPLRSKNEARLYLFGDLLHRSGEGSDFETALPLQLDRDWWLFGYDSSLEDQRMNHLCFELHPPIELRATVAGKVQAEGKVFVHLYPSGYVVVHLAVVLKHRCLESLASLRRAVLETRPWRSDGTWIWSSKLGTAKLREVIELVQSSILGSVFIDLAGPTRQDRWHFAIRLLTKATASEIVSGFIEGQYEQFNLARSEEYLLSSRQGVICGLSESRSRWRAHSLFWQVFTLYEFVLLKYHIYDSYADFLRSEIGDLRERRLGVTQKLAKEGVLRLSAYDRRIPRYLLTLDTYIRALSPFLRRVYSSLSDGTGFGERRARLLELVEEWEEEVEKWEPIVVMLWKKIVSPLHSLLGLG